MTAEREGVLGEEVDFREEEEAVEVLEEEEVLADEVLVDLTEVDFLKGDLAKEGETRETGEEEDFHVVEEAEDISFSAKENL
jgi:hypothetical protein